MGTKGLQTRGQTDHEIQESEGRAGSWNYVSTRLMDGYRNKQCAIIEKSAGASIYKQ